MKSMGVGRQLVLLVAAFTLVTLVTAGVLSFQLSRTSAGTLQLATGIQVMNESLFGLVGAVADVQMVTQKVIRERDPDKIEILIEQEKNARNAAEAKIAGIDARYPGVRSSYGKLVETNARVIELLMLGQQALAQQKLIEESNPAFDALLDVLRKAQEDLGKQSAAQMGDTAKSNSTAQRVVLVLLLVGVTSLVLLAVALVRRISTSLGHVADNLKISADQLAGAAGQVSDASQSLAQGASQQAASLEETSASGEQITSLNRQNAANSQSAAEVANEAAGMIGDVNQRLDQMVGSMRQISASGEKISKIIRVIEEIAFQTNILALNAAVEAARAGEAGMGFAVVADEVRNLAQRCAQAAQDTTALIEESIGNANQGVARVDVVVEAIRKLTDRTQRLQALVDQVSRASNEQAHGMESISQALSQMQSVTQRTAANAEESAAASEQLRAQSETLRAVTGELDALVSGHVG